jgi:vacuolar iron transporter family protein
LALVILIEEGLQLLGSPQAGIDHDSASVSTGLKVPRITIRSAARMRGVELGGAVSADVTWGPRPRLGECAFGWLALASLCLLVTGFFGVYRCGRVDAPSHRAEPQLGSVSSTLNWLRAGVLGANDGIVSTAGIVVGVAAASVARGPILTAGIAALVAGAVSMALGEYVSVSTQRDTEQALLSKERRELRDDPAAELNELAALYEAKGPSAATARTVAEELTDHDPFAAHAEVELGIDPEELTNPWQAALSFTLGALLPLIATWHRQRLGESPSPSRRYSWPW